MSDISLPRRVPSNLHAIVLMVVGMVSFALTDTIIRHTTASAGLGKIIFLHSIFGLLTCTLLMRRSGQRITRELVTDRIVILRISGDIVSILLMTTALGLMPVAQVSAIMQTQPLVLTIGAVLFLRESVSWFRWAAVAVGFVGALIILQPGTDSYTSASLLVLGGVMAQTWRDLLTRLLSSNHSTLAVATLTTAAVLVAGGVTHVISGDSYTIDATTLALLALTGIVGALGYFAVVQSMRIGEISAIAPFRYARLIGAFLFAYVLLGEQPALTTLIGAMLIVAGGLVVFYRERRKARDKPSRLG